MSLTDYFNKHIETARRDGVLDATHAAVDEVISKTVLRWIIDRRVTPIWSYDWDVCLVLDACRWDMWEEVDGRGQAVWSVDSSSLEWIRRTFAEEFGDYVGRTGYVTANPNTDRTDLLGERLTYIDELWRDRWDTNAEKTVSPTDVTDRAIWAWQNRNEFGFDRLVVHYMQPHAPFRSLGGRGGWAPGQEGYQSVWKSLRDGEITRERLLEAYEDNLEWVLQEVERWERSTAVDILVTSDHGNAMGELNEWGHPNRSGNPVVRRVPLVNIRGEITESNIKSVDPPGNPPATSEDTPATVKDRLRGFGYL